MRQLMFSSAIVLAIALPSAAQAQQGEAPPSPTAPNSGATAYQASYFAQYAPRNALDIARQVPGFALDLGSSGTRGFAGAAGNVVINGSRPSSKSESLDVVLAAIPANRVARVEIGPGARFGADYA